MFFQQPSDDIALHPFAFAVNQAYFAKASPLALNKIFFDDAGNVFRVKRMEIEVILYGNDNRVSHWRWANGHGCALSVVSKYRFTRPRKRAALAPSTTRWSADKVAVIIVLISMASPSVITRGAARPTASIAAWGG